MESSIRWHPVFTSLLVFFSFTSSSSLQLCPHDQSFALLQLKATFSIDCSASSDSCSRYDPKTISWKKGTDCCLWDGVHCDTQTGNVIGLDLSCSCLRGTVQSNSSLFLLHHLCILNLAYNDFSLSQISSEFVQFTSLTHLNISDSGFSGLVSSVVPQLSKLVSLDLSYNYELRFDRNTFEKLLGSLNRLRDLFLDGVNLSSIAPTSFLNLSSSITSLTLSGCGLKGKFHDGVLHFPHLQKLSLSYNDLIGFSGLVSSAVPQLSRLVSLDLSYNFQLRFDRNTFEKFLGSLNRLRDLFLDGVNLSSIAPTSFLNLSSSITSLTLSGCGLKGKFPDGVLHFPHLQKLSLSDNGDLIVNFPKTNWSSPLRSLELSSTVTSVEIPDSIGNLRSLEVLDLSDCHVKGSIPSSISNLKQLLLLDLSYNFLEGQIPDAFGNLTRLYFLSLAGNNFSGHLPSSVFELMDLESLDLSSNKLSGIVDYSLPNLRSLSLSSCNLSGFPDFIRNLEGLEDLDLSRNQIPVIDQGMFLRLENLTWLDLSDNSQLSFSSFSSANYSLPNLRTVSLSSCNLSGFPDFIRNLEGLERLDLSRNQIPVIDQGMFSRLENLRFLDLSHNSQLSFSSFSSANYSLPNLRSVSLSSCNISGFPDFIRNLEGLDRLDLSRNQIPVIDQGMFSRLENLFFLNLSHNSQLSFSSFSSANFSLPNLGWLYLSFCNISGFPDFVRNLEGLEHLDLSHNQIPVIDQGMFSRLENLSFLSLSHNSQLSFSSFSSANFSLPNLRLLDFSSCSISEFPNFLRTLKKLEYLNLSNNSIQGRVSKWESEGWPSLIRLDLSHNLLTGLDHYPGKNLQVLLLQSNLLEGPILVPPPSIRVFIVSGNKLTGEIPSLICNLSSLQILDLSDNNLSGTMPTCLGFFINNLNVLDLQKNSFHGSIPDSFANATALQSLNLNGNDFDGPLPQSLVNCSMLAVLNLGNNRLNDTFPYWLGSLLRLQVLVLRFNNFHGPIGKAKTESPFPKLRILDLSHNDFSGVLPTTYFKSFKGMMNLDNVEVGYMRDGIYYQDSMVVSMKGSEFKLERILTVFTTIDLSSNQFEGKIPERVGELTSLNVLNLSHNSLSGSIPSSLGKLAAVESLDLSSNKLVGEIPKQLTNLKFLEVLNLSHNQLSGPIPGGNQFNTFPNDSYSDNLGLCGFPLSNRCSKNEAPAVPEEDDGSASGFEWKGVIMGYGCGLVFGLSAGYIIFTIGKPGWLVKMVERAGNKLKRITGKKINW